MAQGVRFFRETGLPISANSSEEKFIPGRFLYILDLTATDNVFIEIDDQGKSKIKKGLEVELPEGDQFRKLRFINENGSSITLDYAISDGRVKDNAFTVANTITVKSGGNVNTPASVSVGDTATEIVASGSTKTTRIIQNQGATNSVWIGDANVNPATNRGIKLEPGDSITLACTGQIQGRCEATKSTKVSVLEIAE